MNTWIWGLICWISYFCWFLCSWEKIWNMLRLQKDKFVHFEAHLYITYNDRINISLVILNLEWDSSPSGQIYAVYKATLDVQGCALCSVDFLKSVFFFSPFVDQAHVWYLSCLVRARLKRLWHPLCQEVRGHRLLGWPRSSSQSESGALLGCCVSQGPGIHMMLMTLTLLITAQQPDLKPGGARH